ARGLHLTMQQESQMKLPEGFDKRTRHYAEIVNPLFWDDKFYNADTLFEFVCTLVRAGGMQDAGWDAYDESQATLDDLRNLSDLELPAEQFPNADRTRVRLALLSYCHVTEMDTPYSLTANPLRVRLGHKHDISPFRDLYVPIRAKQGVFPKLMP